MKERQPPKRSAQSMPQPIISALCKDEEPSPKRICHADHSYCNEDSPKKLRRDLQKLRRDLQKSNAKVIALQKKIKAQQGKLRRWRLKITSLKTVVKHLKKKQLISPSCEEILNQTVSGIPLELMKRLNDGKPCGKGCRYPPELKSFALTLQFYSANYY